MRNTEDGSVNRCGSSRECRGRWGVNHGVLGLLVMTALFGCKDITGSQPLPAGTANPSNYNTVAGALGERNAAVSAFETMLPSLIIDGGALTDELISRGGPFGSTKVDQRTLAASSPTLTVSQSTDDDYNALNFARTLTNQALGQLATYDPSGPPALRGELYALQGYTEILLADLFCSGIPLSTLDYQKDYTYAAGSTTAEVYQDAVTKFDSALALAQDSAPILNLARVGKGRALLDQGNVAAAAQAVAAVPSTFVYTVYGKWGSPGYGGFLFIKNGYMSADREGTNGLPFLSSTDPRSRGAILSGNLTLPAKLVTALNGAGYAPLPIADGTEARLIQAEAALAAGDSVSWLTLLNNLRDSAVVLGVGQPEPQLLPPLAMPSTDTAQVSLLFRERAEWLYFTGHRQGDLRRLIRQYGRRQDQIYPIGVYLPGGGFYGNDVTAPIPGTEYANPKFHGCLDRNA